MLVLSEAATVLAWVTAYRRASLRVGLVPTMGALHEGHLSLIRTARRETERVVVSIFVNPLQFGPSEDLDRYPRPFAADHARCEETGVDLLYHGQTDDFFPEDFQTAVSVERLTRVMCGPRRPGHFTGVCTVVTKLLSRTTPHVAYFGQKDYQQALVIRRMVHDLDFPVKVRILPTVRESDGLALSSRNAYLEGPERIAARCLWQGLSAAVQLAESGERRAGRIREACAAILAREPRARTDYMELADAETLDPFPNDAVVDRRAVLAIAVKIGSCRLIDNVIIAA